MQINIRAGYEKIGSNDFDLRVIIDVFRAATTAVTLFDEGVAELLIANDLETLTRLSNDGYLVISEVFDLGLDNSPTQVKRACLKGRKTALKTSNLTTALEKNNHHGDIILCCFNNLNAVVEAIHDRQYKRIEIIPAGTMSTGKMAAEDFHCAEVLRNSLLKNEVLLPDFNFLANLIREKCEGKNRPPHFVEDLKLAIQSNISSSVPIVSSKKNGVFDCRRLGSDLGEGSLLRFIPFHEQHLPLFRAWLSQDHIKKFWQEPARVGGGWWKNEKAGTFGIDLMIGDKTSLGKGVGPKVITRFIFFLKSQNPQVTSIIIDPDPTNEVAIKAFKAVVSAATGLRLRSLNSARISF